jgi:hypothetical protein
MAKLNIITVDSVLVASKKRRQEVIKALARNGVPTSSIDITNPSLTTIDTVATIIRKSLRINQLSDTEKRAIIIN